jgi:DNA-directed RNA polymerase specialized sigma24 family protein
MDREKPIRAELFWVLRAQVGDRAAFDLLFEWNERLLRPHLQAIVRDAAAVEDILQNVLLIIYRKIEWLDDPALFRPWLFRIATREALKYRRRQSERREDQFDESFDGFCRRWRISSPTPFCPARPCAVSKMCPRRIGRFSTCTTWKK